MSEGNKCAQCGTPLPAGALGGLCPACLLKAGAAADSVTEAAQPPFQPPSVTELAAKFPQLEILELIGKGGMGAVYKARQQQLDRIVALKILPPGIGGDPAFAERFAREAKALARLNHPGIVTIYDFGRADGLFYFLMEFVDGVNLRQLLHAGRVSPREALAIVPQICDALQYAHDQGIVHRDIKPENILLDRRGRVKVADFGLVKIVGSESSRAPRPDAARPAGQAALTESGKVMGTPQYMAPEQQEHPDVVDHRADIYALGVVFYQMLTGELPGKKIEPPSARPGGLQIDVRLDEVVLRALEKKPELRYQQASVLKTEVETIAGTPAAGLKTGGPFKITNATPLSKFLFWCAVPIFGCYFFLLLNDHFNGTNQKLWHYFSYVFLTFAVVCGVDTIIRIRRTLRAKSSAAGQELHRISRTMLISGTLAATIVLYFVAWPAFHKNHDSTKAAIAVREPVPMAANTNGPAVVEVSPADGATNVDPVQELRIRFDQPMNPADMWLDWRSGGFLPRGFPRYDTARNEFVIPVRLQRGATNQLSLNWAERGFRNFDSIPAREFHWQFITRPAPISPGAGKPRVVRISPGPGTTLPVLTQFEITFDRPMMPPDECPPYLKKVGWFDTLPTLLPDIAYDTASNRFIVPVILAPDNETRLTLLGFNSADGVASDPVVISCVTGTNNLSAAQMAEITAAARDPRLEQLLAAMKTAREQLRSGVETVRTFSFSGTEGSFDRNLSAEAATFKWQGTNQAYADISDVMNCKSFILGNDGSNCWLYAENARNGPRLNRTPTASVAEIQTSIADPFGLMKHPVSFVLERDHLVYCGQEVIDGRTCHRVQSYFVKQSADQPSGISAARMDWWIDTNTFLPVQVVQAAPFGRQIFRFEFRQLNQPLAVTAFQPPANGRAKADEWFEKKLQPEEQRYLTIRDGGNGRMSVRIGRQGQNGSTSSGLN